MNKPLTFALVLLTLLVSACSIEVDDTQTEGYGKSGSHATLGANQVALILAFVNHPGTDYDTLDQLVRLDRRAAENIIAHRDGADGVVLTGDDQPFHQLADLLAIKFVGDSALNKLNAYAASNPPPAGEIAEGVEFSGWERQAVLFGVSNGSADELRAAGLNATQAANLVASAPYETITAIGDVAQIGPAALGKLRSAAAGFWHQLHGSGGKNLAGTYDGVAFDHETATVALEIANLAPLHVLTGASVHTAGAQAIVAARPHADLAAVAATSGVGTATMQGLYDFAAAGSWSAPVYGDKTLDQECSAKWDCAQGLICAGYTLDFAICRPEWMAGAFHNKKSTAIPDGSASGIKSTLQVSGLASVPEDVILHLDIDHPRPSDLRVVLEQPGWPSGAQAIVWQPGSAGPSTVIVGWGIERDAMVNGTWALYVVDTVTGEAGTLKGWSLELTSRWD